MTDRYRLPALAALAIALLSGLLYIPFLGNALVFDDHNLFTNLSVYDFAQRPFDFQPRTFPYFTLGLVQVLTESIVVQRAISLALHVLCAWLLFALLRSLQRQAQGASGAEAAQPGTAQAAAAAAAAAGALWFALHPVAVYGAGYLAQRTILFATLFSLLSLWFYRRAFAENRITDIVTAALFYSAAVFSKEHAIMLPLAAAPLAFLYGRDARAHVPRIALYFLLCLPAGVTAVLAARYAVATGYEPYVGQVTSQIKGIPLLDTSWGPWFVSATMQAGAFFDYLYYWIVPDVRALSADIRIDVVRTWNSIWMALKAASFVAWPAAAVYCLRRGGRSALFGCGMLYSWLLFATELSTVRFQEPFVLYRSYLWAPGFAMMLAAVLGRWNWRPVLAGLALATPLLLALAHDRLSSFTSEGALWEDAAAKLSSPDLPGADRIFYNRAGERFKKAEFAAAMDDLARVVALNPGGFQGYLGRGKVYLQWKKYAEALAELDRSLSCNPPPKGMLGLVQFHRGNALDGLGRRDEAWQAYQASAADGFYAARMLVQARNK